MDFKNKPGTHEMRLAWATVAMMAMDQGCYIGYCRRIHQHGGTILVIYYRCVLLYTYD